MLKKKFFNWVNAGTIEHGQKTQEYLFKIISPVIFV